LITAVTHFIDEDPESLDGRLLCSAVLLYGGTSRNAPPTYSCDVITTGLYSLSIDGSLTDEEDTLFGWLSPPPTVPLFLAITE